MRVSFPWIPASVDLKAPVTKSPLSIHQAAKETNRLVISLGLEFLEFLLFGRRRGGSYMDPEIYIYTKLYLSLSPTPPHSVTMDTSPILLCTLLLYPWLLNFLLSDVLIFRFQIFIFIFFGRFFLYCRGEETSPCASPPPDFNSCPHVFGFLPSNRQLVF